MKQQVGKAWQEIFPQAGGSGWPQVGVLPRVSFVVCGAAPPRLPFGLFPRVVLITGEGNGNPLQCSCLENPRDGRAWWAAVHGVTELDTIERLHFHFSLSCIGEGNGNPLQCSCLENPRDGRAWWAAIWGHTELDTTEAT